MLSLCSLDVTMAWLQRDPESVHALIKGSELDQLRVHTVRSKTCDEVS